MKEEGLVLVSLFLLVSACTIEQPGNCYNNLTWTGIDMNFTGDRIHAYYPKTDDAEIITRITYNSTHYLGKVASDQVVTDINAYLFYEDNLTKFVYAFTNRTGSKGNGSIKVEWCD